MYVLHTLTPQNYLGRSLWMWTSREGLSVYFPKEKDKQQFSGQSSYSQVNNVDGYVWYKSMQYQVRGQTRVAEHAVWNINVWYV